jgi:hypothetical protein
MANNFFKRISTFSNELAFDFKSFPNEDTDVLTNGFQTIFMV